MKFNFKLSGKTPTSITNLFRQPSRRGYMDPARDWAIGLCIAIVLFVGGAIYIAFDFYNQLGGAEVAEIEDIEQPIIYRDKEVIFYAGEFVKKETRFNQLRGEHTSEPIEETASEEEGKPSTENATEETVANPDPIAE